MTLPNKYDLSARLDPFGQQHVLHFWDELNEADRRRLADQIAAIDLEQLAELYRSAAVEQDWAELSRRAQPPRALRLADRAPAGDASKTLLGWSIDDARQRGRQALADGKIGVLLVAGGQGSRLGFEHPKGMYPIGPVSGASLLQIHIEKVRAAAAKCGARVPFYLMNSPATQEAQSAYLLENDRFGLAEDDLFVFCQGTMPAVDAQTGRLLLAEKGRLFTSPDGHGGTVAALAASGAIDHMHRRGVEHLFYFQVDNPLVPICDAELIGHHLLAESELTSIAIAKLEPRDMVGNFVSIDDHVHVIEYSDFPDDVAKQREADGSLRFWAGSIAIHVFDVAFLERSLTLKDALPFHIAQKKVPYLDESGTIIEPETPNALKFERFIFDLLPHAENALVVEHSEADCFAPLKNAPPEPRDTEEYVQRMMIDQHCRWLRSAGALVADDVAVEISPLWALDADDVAAQIEPGATIEEPIYLTK